MHERADTARSINPILFDFRIVSAPLYKLAVFGRQTPLFKCLLTQGILFGGASRTQTNTPGILYPCSTFIMLLPHIFATAGLVFTPPSLLVCSEPSNIKKERRCQNEKNIHFAIYSISFFFLLVKLVFNHRSYLVTASKSAFIMLFALKSCKIAVCVGRPLSKDIL